MCRDTSTRAVLSVEALPGREAQGRKQPERLP